MTALGGATAVGAATAARAVAQLYCLLLLHVRSLVRPTLGRLLGGMLFVWPPRAAAGAAQMGHLVQRRCCCHFALVVDEVLGIYTHWEQGNTHIL